MHGKMKMTSLLSSQSHMNIKGILFDDSELSSFEQRDMVSVIIRSITHELIGRLWQMRFFLDRRDDLCCRQTTGQQQKRF